MVGCAAIRLKAMHSVYSEYVVVWSLRRNCSCLQ